MLLFLSLLLFLGALLVPVTGSVTGLTTTAFGLLVLASLSESIRRFRRTRMLADPAVWFPPAALLVSGGVILSSYFFGPPPWYVGLNVFGDARFSRLHYANVVAYVAMIAAFSFAGPTQFRAMKPAALPDLPEPLVLAKIGMATGSLALWFEITQRGVGTFFSGYGSSQFTYDALYYVHQLAQLLWFPSFAAWAALTAAVPKRFALSTFWHLTIFVVPLVVWGDRSSLVYAAALFMVPAYFANPQSRAFRASRLLVVGVLGVTLAGLLSFWRSVRDFTEIAQNLEFLNAFVILMRFLGETGGVVLATMELVPEHLAFQGGASILSAVGNLIPGFFFDGPRPFAVPSLLFHEAYRPDVTTHGFGFALMAEGYMSAGLAGVFLFFAAASALLRYSYSLAVRGGALPTALFALVAYQSFWLLRADTTVFLKSVLFGSAGVIAIFGISRQYSLLRASRP